MNRPRWERLGRALGVLGLAAGLAFFADGARVAGGEATPPAATEVSAVPASPSAPPPAPPPASPLAAASATPAAASAPAGGETVGPPTGTPQKPESLGKHLRAWSVLPFVLMLLAIAVVPLVRPHWWEHNRNRALVSGFLSALTGFYLLAAFGGEGGLVLLETLLLDYLPFLVLLTALFIISGGIVLRGRLAGTPEVNAVFLAVGAIVASFIGTTGASMVLIRPLLRANQARRHKVHVIVFFIFMVSNIGGLLTPLGDPPLFLGFLKGVPFLWTLRLWKEWLFANAVLLAVFYVVDNVIFRREDVARRRVDLDEAVQSHQPLELAGRRNFLFLAGVVAVIYLSGTLHGNLRFFLEARGVRSELALELIAKGLQVAGMLLMAALSLKFTSKKLHRENGFAWGPIVEVAVLFFGIFVTMIPAIQILNFLGQPPSDLPVSQPWHFFWASGSLSSFLDNAPTYLTFAATAAGTQGVEASGNYLGLLLEQGETAAKLLAAVSCGAVFMGANTYIGNAPNFMVKSIAESSGIKMPSFFGYMLYSLLILVPLFVVVTLIFFR